MILIVGGTGTMGSLLTRLLLAEDQPVRVMTRNLNKAAELEKLGAEVVEGDLLDKASLARACTDAKAVVATAHSILGRGREASKYVDLQGHKDLIDVAQAEGIQHFVYVSVYDHGPAYRQVPFWHIKSTVEGYLRDSGLPYTILRPTAFMEFHAETLIGLPVIEKGKVTLFGRGENPRNFVAAGDVAQIARFALKDHKALGQTIDIGGPENLTNMQVVRLYEKLAGRPAKVGHVPIGVLQVMYRVLRPFHPGLSQIMQSSINSDTSDSTCDPGPLLARYPLKLNRLEEWAKRRVQAGTLSIPLAVAG